MNRIQARQHRKRDAATEAFVTSLIERHGTRAAGMKLIAIGTDLAMEASAAGKDVANGN